MITLPPQIPLTLAAITFTTEDVDEETRRVMVLTWEITPLTTAIASALNIKSILFNGDAPKEPIHTIAVRLDVPPQDVLIRSAPDMPASVHLRNVAIGPLLRAKVKRDREPAELAARFEMRSDYPDADTLLLLATAVETVQYVTCEPEQGDLLTTAEAVADTPPRRRGKAAIEAGEELRPRVHAEH